MDLPVSRRVPSWGSSRPRRTSQSFEFKTGEIRPTRVIIRRGFARDPDAGALFPPDAASSPHFLFTDPRVGPLHGEGLARRLCADGWNVKLVTLPEGETAKSLDVYARCVAHLVEEGLDEGSVLVSVGGGVVCNVTGFLAATVYRGLGLVHVPTTLMAQADAAISHKQAVNGHRGKNLVGSCYGPRAIVVDPSTLDTLRDDQISDGLSEVIKHALAQDGDYLDFLLDPGVSWRSEEFLDTVVTRNIELKCALMAIDSQEKREGMVLQYGHTVGHPIECVSGFALTHGQAVALGMMVAARVSEAMGLCSRDTVEIHGRVLERYGLPTRIPANLCVDDIVDALRYNKRYRTTGTRMALVGHPGGLAVVSGDYAIAVDERVLRQAIASSFAS